MQVLPGQTATTDNSGSECEDPAATTSSGWESIVEHFQDSNRRKVDVVKLANSKSNLFDLFPRYGVVLEEVYSSTGWSYKGQCPFKDHSDRTPSFGYNPKMDVFNCFGCHRSGRSVEFISFMDGRDKNVVASELLERMGGEITFESSGIDFSKLRDILFEFGEYIQRFKKENPSENAYRYSKDVTWNLDVYLRRHAPGGTIDLDDLVARINILKEQLALYSEEE